MKRNKGKPYIIKRIVTEKRMYNPEYGDDRVCECGHKYYRHFDWMDNDYPCGCKYCNCYTFKERNNEKPKAKMD